MEKERTKMETRLSELRRAKGLSQNQLADTIHVCRQSISDWERGVSRPTRENLVLLSELYGVSVDYLLEREPQTPPEEVTQPQMEETEPLTPETEGAEVQIPPIEPEEAEPFPEGKTEKNLERRLWFYRSITLALVILLMMMTMLFIQGRKEEYPSGETIPIAVLPTDTIVLIEEFE